jgi:membrane protease YdiL (CAAX protease family)
MDATLRPYLAASVPRPRAFLYRRAHPWARVGLYLAGCVGLSALWCLLLFIVFRPGFDIFSAPERYPVPANLYMVGTYGILIGGALWSWCRLQGESLRTLGLTRVSRAGQRFALGVWWGVASIGGLIGLELALGWLWWNGPAWSSTPAALIASTAVTALFFGFSEELLFRGFVFQTLKRGLALPWAMVGSAWLYAQVHFLRFDLHWQQVATPLLGLFGVGLILAWVAHQSRSIWWGVGLHSAWVFVFFLSDRQKILLYPPVHNWLTGAGYPLAGAMGLALLVVLGAVVAWRFRRAG